MGLVVGLVYVDEESRPRPVVYNERFFHFFSSPGETVEEQRKKIQNANIGKPSCNVIVQPSKVIVFYNQGAVLCRTCSITLFMGSGLNYNTM